MLQTSGMLLHSFATPHRCASCGHAKLSYGGASQSLLGGGATDYEDVEEARDTSDPGAGTPRMEVTRSQPLN